MVKCDFYSVATSAEKLPFFFMAGLLCTSHRLGAWRRPVRDRPSLSISETV